MFKGPQIFSLVHHEEGGPSSHEKVKETETIGVPVFVTYKRGTRKLFVGARRVLSPQGLKGVSPSSLGHRKILSPKGVEGALPSSSAKQVQVKQQRKGKEKVQEKDLSDEKERDFNLVDHEEP